MKRPLLSVALIYVAGLLLGNTIPISLTALLPLAFALLLVSLFSIAWRHFSLGALVLVSGWINMVLNTAEISPFDLRKVIGSEPAIVSVRGILAETPSTRVFMRDEKEVWRTMGTLAATSIRRAGSTNWEPVVGKVLVITPGKAATNLYAGTEMELQGVIAFAPGPAAPGLFDYRRYLANEGIYYQIKSLSTDEWIRLGGPAEPSWSDRFLAWAQMTMARGLPVEDDSLHLLWAMTLGWKTGMTNEIYQPFMKSGTMHIFAISGLHIALIAAIMVQLLRVLRVSRIWCGLVVIPLIFFYTAATGWQPSALRSTVMMLQPMHSLDDS